MKQTLHRFGALSLALALLLAAALPVTAAKPIRPEKEAVPIPEEPLELDLFRTGAPEPSAEGAALLAAGRYEIECDGSQLWSDRSASGVGWQLQAAADTTPPALFLNGSYSGRPIRASGDLAIYLTGSVELRGASVSAREDGSAITVEGNLMLISNSGVSVIRGADADQSGLDGGTAVRVQGTAAIGVVDSTLKLFGGCSEDGTGGDAVQCIPNPAISGSGWIQAALNTDNNGKKASAQLYLTGGDSTGGIGGDGLDAYSLVKMDTRPSFGWYLCGEPYLMGEAQTLGQVEITGGSGRWGGCGISAGSVALNSDGVIRGGSGDAGQKAGSAVEALGCFAGDYYPDAAEDRVELSVDLTLRAGDPGMYAVRKYSTDGSAPAQLEVRPGPHSAVTARNSGELAIRPQQYQVTVEGSGSQTVGRREGLLLPQVSPNGGRTLVGFWDGTDLLFRPGERYYPWRADETLTAQWLGDRELLFIGEGTPVEGQRCVSRRAGQPVSTPEVQFSDGWMIGWCSGAQMELSRDSGTRELGGKELWLPAGETVAVEECGVFYPIRVDTQKTATICYHGNGGVRANGSPMAVRYGRDTENALTVGGNCGFARVGYTFAGWQDASGSRLSAGQTVPVGQHPAVWAVWEPAADLLADFETVLSKDTVQTMAAFYDREDRLLLVLEGQRTTRFHVPAQMAEHIKTGKLFQLDGQQRPTAPPVIKISKQYQ